MCPHSICLSLQKIPTTKVYTFALQPQAKSYNSSFDAHLSSIHTVLFTAVGKLSHPSIYTYEHCQNGVSQNFLFDSKILAAFGRAFAAMFSLPKKRSQGEKKQMPKMPSWNISLIGAMSISVQAQPCSCTFSSISITIYHHIATMSV